MAVSGADLASLRQQQQALSAQLSRTQEELHRTRQQLAAENSDALARLRTETEARIASREGALRDSYETLLRETASAQESALEAEFRRIRQQYDAVTAELNTAMMQEHRETEALLLHQRAFEQAYYARQKFAEDRAAEARRRAGDAVRQAAADTPLEWFLPGHLDLYNARLRELAQWMEEGFYESVIGISENLLLTVQLDVLEAEKQFRRWQQYYSILRGVLDAQRALLFEDAVRVPEELVRFARSRDIRDGIMGAETLAYWSDGAYPELLTRYEQNRRMLAEFEEDGTLGADESSLRACMRQNPRQAERYPTDRLYRLAVRLTAEYADAENTIRQMRMRMQRFEERMAIVEEVRASLRAEGCAILATQMLGRPGDPLLVRFADELRTMAFELMLIPVLRRSDTLWVNQAVCSIPAECSPEREGELLHTLAEVFAERGIELPVQRMRPEQTTQERVALAVTDLQMKINGRLN